MGFNTSQHMRMGQQMKLAPRVIQSMEILQLALPALQERIDQELESNVALETYDPATDGDEATPREDTGPDLERELDVGSGTSEGDFARLDAMESSYEEAFDNEYSAARVRREEKEYIPLHQKSRMAGERDAKMDAMANTAAPGPSLTQQLSEQWSLSDVDEDTKALGSLILEFIDGDGYLRTDLGTIAERANMNGAAPTVEELETALQKMQRVLDPTGVAARDVRECLLLQLDAIEEEEGDDDELDHVRALIKDYLEDLSHNRMPRVEQLSGLTMDQIREAMKWMQRLSLAPGRQLVDESPQIIVPDAIVEYDEDNDQYVAYMTDGRIPGLRINPAYSDMAKDRNVEKKTRDFIKTNLSNAHWLIDALNQRRQTLQRVLNVVLTAQRDFFDYGPAALKPLPMTQVADQLGVHVATVSRAVAGKYLQTPRGVFPLRKFFTGGMQNESGEDVSWDSVRAALQEVIDGEDKSKPYSDEALVEELKKRGLDIARRTVAKYRAQMDVPSARMRKQY